MTLSQDQVLPTIEAPADGTATSAVDAPASAGLEWKARLIRSQVRAGMRIGQVVLTADEGGSRHVVRLLGKIEGVSMIVSNPLDDGRLLFVPEGRGYTVRVFDGRDLSQFHATVLKTYTQPHPHLHLSMPSQEAQRVRVKPDYSVETVLRGAIRYDAAAHFTRQLDTLIVELSGTSAVCLPAKPLAREETRIRLLMELPLAAERPKLDVEASVVGRDPVEIEGEQGELLTLGFEKLSEVSKYRLRTFAAETLLAEMVAQRSRRGV